MRPLAAIALLMLGFAVPLACGSSNKPSGFDPATGGDGGSTDGPVLGTEDGPTFEGDGGSGDDASGDGACGPNLTGVLRDFHDTHPDFEKFLDDDRGIVKTDLGADYKPVYASATKTPTTTGKADFDQWYRDVPGVNVSQLFTVPLAQLPNGISSYDNPAFFPLDNQGFGNEGRDHNFHFTFELHTEFIYKGGEVFTFIGDDDVFTFINSKLAIDLGGVHGAETQSVDLDKTASTLGITKGKKYPLDVFQAERHTSQSHFRIDTSIEFTNCRPILH
jgi:fibro-slime domain-containing protein